MCFEAKLRAEAVRDSELRCVAALIEEIGARPGPPRLPRKVLGHNSTRLRGDIPFAGIGPRDAAAGVDLEWLVRLTKIHALALGAPAERHVVSIVSPGAAHIDTRLRGGLPPALGRDLPMPLIVLLPIAVRVAGAAADARAEDVGTV